MAKQLTLIFTLILTLNTFSQSVFVKGYYIDNSDKKTNCLIKNEDWLNNPTEFKYKTNINSEKKTLTIKSVKEFGLLNTSKYVRHAVDIDRSSKVHDEIGYNKNPIFNKEKLFLKVLIEGKATLYYYEDQGLVRYFFSKDYAEVKQLVFKYYLTYENDTKINNQFRRQLWVALKCESILMNSLKKLDYRKSDLIKFFIKYNECSNSEYINYEKKKKNSEIKDFFNLTLRPGVRNSSVTLHGTNRGIFDFGKNLTSFRIGLESEFVLGFNNNKWAIIIEPTYQQFKSETSVVSNITTGDKLFATINFNSLEVNLGVRHYIFLNKDFKLFANISGAYVNSLDSTVDVIRENGRPFFSAELENSINVTLGVGCKYKERYILELRYLPSRNILNTQGAWGTDFSSLSIVLGYSFL
jgi:hypothetical protein